MANLLGHKAWNRTKSCKRIGCCTRPRRTSSGQRLSEERQWGDDWFEETAPDYPEWIDRVANYMKARYNLSD
jgi:hypothetical protein